jgi:hypothetical protein
MPEIAYHLEIYGRTWAGFKAVYQYPGAADITAENVKRFAPDFAEVLDWRLVRAEHRYGAIGRGLSRRSDTYRTLRGFRNGMTPQRFYRLANGG